MMSKDVKIVFTGPESTGKTSLARALASALGRPWVPEFARPYLTYFGRPYERADLDRMAAGQAAWEQWYREKSPGLLICDTDWTVFQVWDDYKYEYPGLERAPDYAALALSGQIRFAPKQEGPPARTHYFLCYPDFTWEPDPLREHPEQRMALYSWYLALLQAEKVDYTILEGDSSTRLRGVLAVVQNF